ncbi:MAG TPA: type II toxin-antitoxin system prevent-host-death family antitoxin [Thermoanaerobaculia bacterium]|nr:type II toxin-antitoxin system prevent-host-death family antitoxin [Thermoanaerobaculia bacterium]
MKSVTIEELREKLDEVIADVDRGEPVSITRNGGHFATVQPWLIPPRDPGRPQDVTISPLSKPLTFDPVELLIEDRESEWEKYGW